MIDPSHGGNDRGAILPGRVEEKELTLTLARELRKQLEARGVRARLLRESDVDLSLERRAEITNQEHAGLYLVLHAGLPANGVRVYWSAMTTAQTRSASLIPRWESAQTESLGRSRSMASRVADQIRKSEMTISLLTAPLRPLNNVLAPAIAVEWAPSPADLKPPQSTKVATRLASAVAEAVARARGSSEARP
jgi:N-acetylmuramoyl-L-alanine amidase